jgi:hypothetical protein
MVLREDESMSKSLIGVLGTTLLVFSLTILAVGQTPTTTVKQVQAIQNSDGTYTIVEYPVGKETIVSLNPVALSGATGTATILRAADGTIIKLNLTGLPTEVTAMNVYAVDPSGKITLLGPVQIVNGTGTFKTSTPMSKFMLVTAPDDALTAYNDSTLVFFRSTVPTGLAAIPITNAVGEQVAAVVVPTTVPAIATVPATVTVPAIATVPTATVPAMQATATVPAIAIVPAIATVPTTKTVAVLTDYTVPMLGIPTFKRGDDTKLKINFSGTMEGARANVFIDPHKNGKTTEVRMRFHDLKEAPKGQVYILWAVTADGQFTQLGQIVNVKGRNEAEIKSEVAYDDFGLLLTTETVSTTQGTIIKPSGERVGVIQIVP